MLCNNNKKRYKFKDKLLLNNSGAKAYRPIKKRKGQPKLTNINTIAALFIVFDISYNIDKTKIKLIPTSNMNFISLP